MSAAMIGVVLAALMQPAPAPTPTPETPTSPPPPPPVPRMWHPRFYYDSGAVRPRGSIEEVDAIIDDSIGYYGDGQTPTCPAGMVPHILIVGYADTLGSAEANRRLSHRRAQWLVRRFIERGAPREWMATDWRGETENAVATGDGVAEILNRRIYPHLTCRPA